MGGGLLLLTLIAVYIVVYWLMAAEKNPSAKYSGILGFLKCGDSKSTHKKRKAFLKSRTKQQGKWKSHQL
jgi:hypothetical protein